VKRRALAVVFPGSLVTLLLFGRAMFGQTTKVNGLITGRKAASMTVQTSSETKLVVVLTHA
jgi:hypothetical protein